MVNLVLNGNGRVPELHPIAEIKPCNEELDCGHSCQGCKDEAEHLHCLEPECCSPKDANKHDNCVVCSDELGSQPCISLDCGHVFHAACIRDLLRHRWSTQRTSSNFMRCPSCLAEIKSADNEPQVRMELFSMKILRRNLQKQALKELNQD